MDVTLIRHGTAQDRAATDAARALTPRGEAEARQTGVRLAKLEPAPDEIVSSPYRRALETARLIAEVLGFAGDLVVDEALIPDAPPSGVRDLLGRLSDRRHVVLVAHEPLLSGTCQLLLGIPFSGLGRAEMVALRKSTPGLPHGSDFTLRFRS